MLRPARRPRRARPLARLRPDPARRAALAAPRRARARARTAGCCATSAASTARGSTASRVDARTAAARRRRGRDVRLVARLPRRGAPSDPALAGGRARGCATSPISPRARTSRPAQLARQSRILGVLTRAAAAVVATPTAPRACSTTLLGHLLEAVPASRGAGGALRGRPARGGGGRGARARGRGRPWPIDPAVAERVLRAPGGVPRAARREPATAACAPCCARRCGSAAPAPSPERIAGCVVLEGPADPTPFDEEHLQLVTAVANLAASRLESLRLREENADKRRLEEDLRGAARIQAEPAARGDARARRAGSSPASSRLCSAVGRGLLRLRRRRRRPAPRARRRGRQGPRGRAADGLAARRGAGALARAASRSPRIVARGQRQPARRRCPPNRFATLFLARLDTATGEVTWVNAGHAAALLVRADGGHEVARGHRHHPRRLRGRLVGRGATSLGRRRRARAAVRRRRRGRARGGERARPRAAGGRRPRDGRRLAPRRSWRRCRRPPRQSLGGERRADDHTFVVLRRDRH